ncbi:hypothetical protein D915_001101 [Fasciola hepatica]|uniref:Uncharacterized protein n=1 Tax=Fasciola hepatica TaxID=6192 RepID=A0A4E0RIX3_FASHE|nr:hypothetical protein D915_001101 [Fasciola hepatica]
MTNYFQWTFLTLILGLPFISAVFYAVGPEDKYYTVGERTTPVYEDDIVLDLNIHCPVAEYNVTTGQRIIVVCNRRESMMIQRIYMSTNPETIYVCDTFDPEVHIVASCLGGLRHHELPLTVCEEGLDCQIPIQKGKSVLLFATEQSCIHYVNMLKLTLI